MNVQRAMHAVILTTRRAYQPRDDKQEQLVLSRHALCCSCLLQKLQLSHMLQVEAGLAMISPGS